VPCHVYAHRLAALNLCARRLLQDAVRFLLLGTRPSAALKTENLFLRKQLALYLERKAKPRRVRGGLQFRPQWECEISPGSVAASDMTQVLRPDARARHLVQPV